MHPLARALSELGITQQELVKRVNALRHRRPNGKRVTITQGYVSSLITCRSGASVPIAKAISAAVEGKVSAAEILLYEPRPAAKRKAS